MHCTNSSRKTTLTILDTRRLRLHSTFWTTASALPSSSRQHASSRLLLYLRASIFTATLAKAYTTCDSISGSFISLRTCAWSLDSHLDSFHIILWSGQTAAKSYGKLQKRLSSLLQFIYLTKRDTNLEKALRSGCF